MAWVIGFSNRKMPVRFCTIELHEQGHSFSTSKNTNLKLEIGPHRKQPIYVPWPDYSRLVRARASSPRKANSARTSPWIRTSTRGLHCCTAAGTASPKMEHIIQRQVGSGALATSLCRHTRGSQPWLAGLGPTRRTAHPARLFAAPTHNNSSWSRRLLESLHTH